MEIISINKHRIVLIILIIVLPFFSITGHAQKAKEISLSVYSGFTLVNFEEALDYSDEYMEDWSEIHISASLKGFLLSDKPLQLGAEIAWQNLYYAYYVVPYVPSSVRREFNISTISLMALGRYSVSNFFTTGGAGIHIFDDGISPAISFEAGYKISAGENLKFPVSVRIQPIFGKGTPILFSVGAGMSFTIR